MVLQAANLSTGWRTKCTKCTRKYHMFFTKDTCTSWNSIYKLTVGLTLRHGKCNGALTSAFRRGQAKRIPAGASLHTLSPTNFSLSQPHWGAAACIVEALQWYIEVQIMSQWRVNELPAAHARTMWSFLWCPRYSKRTRKSLPVLLQQMHLEEYLRSSNWVPWWWQHTWVLPPGEGPGTGVTGLQVPWTRSCQMPALCCIIAMSTRSIVLAGLFHLTVLTDYHPLIPILNIAPAWMR